MQNYQLYKVDVEKHNDMIDVEISNVISWELMKIKATKQEIKGLADFLNKFITDDEKQAY